jgi:hypothetical protein
MHNKIGAIFFSIVLCLLVGLSGCITINNPPAPSPTPVTPTPDPTPVPTPTPSPTPIPTPIPTPTPIPVPIPIPTPIPVPYAVTGAIASVDIASSAGPCPHIFNFTGTITSNGPGTVTYRWEKSDGTTGPTQNIFFYSAGSMTVTASWQLSGSSNGWVRLHVFSPNEIFSNQASFSLNCGFSVTSINVGGYPPAPGSSCPMTFGFYATINVTGPGTITYKWERSDNAISPVQSLTFPAAGSQTVNTTWTLSGTYTGWQRLHILTPFDMTSSQMGFSVSCP